MSDIMSNDVLADIDAWLDGDERTEEWDVDLLLVRAKKDLAAAREQVAVLREALQAASAHLDYCGYGDAWEREGAEAAELPERIARALAAQEDTNG